MLRKSITQQTKRVCRLCFAPNEKITVILAKNPERDPLDKSISFRDGMSHKRLLLEIRFFWLRPCRTRYYETFANLTSGINDCLSRVETDYKAELTTLMQPNFQDFKNVNLLAL